MLATHGRTLTFLTTGLFLGVALACAASETESTDAPASGGTVTQPGSGGNTATGNGGNSNDRGGNSSGPTGGKAATGAGGKATPGAGGKAATATGGRMIGFGGVANRGGRGG